MIGDNLQQYTFEYLMGLALSYVPDDRDKRQGSVIYDALAPFCQVLAASAIQLKNFYTQTYAVTATGEDLDNRVAEQGIARYAATYAVRKISVADADGNPVAIPVGARFSTVSNTRPVNYTVTAQYSEDGVSVPGTYEATCEELGVIGNEYYGNLINITFIQGLASAVMSSTLVPARDQETDEELRERYFDTLNQKAFGGNIADYRAKVMDIAGVGAVQIYPVWNGGGTVKLSIVDPTYGPCSPEFIASVQEAIDPENAQGEQGTGLGIAPIGHKVTVVTPDEVTISVDADVVLDTNYTLGHVEEPVREAVSSYIQSLRQDWAEATDLNEYSCNVFVSRVSAAIVAVTGVANVLNVTLNGAAKDISLPQNGAVQQLPKMGEVVLNA